MVDSIDQMGTKHSHTTCHKQRMVAQHECYFYCALYANEYLNRSQRKIYSRAQLKAIRRKKTIDPDFCEIKIQMVHLPSY